MAILRIKRHWGVLIGSLILLYIFPLFGSYYFISLLNHLSIAIIIVLGLQLVSGYCGQIFRTGRLYGCRCLYLSHPHWKVCFNLPNTTPTVAERVYQSLVFVIAVEITTFIHAFGHILSGGMVHSAMDELLITTTRDINLYHGDQSLVPGRVHLVRALGGPVLNLIAAGLFVSLLPGTEGFFSNVLKDLIGTNLFFGIGSFLPIPTVDGNVIWREILRPWRKP